MGGSVPKLLVKAGHRSEFYYINSRVTLRIEYRGTGDEKIAYIALQGDDNIHHVWIGSRASDIRKLAKGLLELAEMLEK